MTQPQVALESTVISHGLPYPQNVELAAEMQPRQQGIMKGDVHARHQ